MVHQRSRLPALLMLLAVLAFGSGMVLARRGNANVAREADLAKLEAAAGASTARGEDWVRYGQALQTCGRLADAIVAFDQALKINAYDRDALLGGGTCRARMGNSKTFLDFMEATINVEPKTAVAIFGRPEAASYLSDTRGQRLKSQADAGAMD